jgi:hypothetical protein
MEKEGKITIQVNYRGELIYVEIDGKRLTEPTGNLAKNAPPGVLNGIIDIGHILCFKRPDGMQGYCVHLPNCNWYCPHP